MTPGKGPCPGCKGKGLMNCGLNKCSVCRGKGDVLVLTESEALEFLTLKDQIPELRKSKFISTSIRVLPEDLWVVIYRDGEDAYDEFTIH